MELVLANNRRLSIENCAAKFWIFFLKHKIFVNFFLKYFLSTTRRQA